jgi:acetyl-CoA decarbonylase/synthase complex subunit beta
LKKFLSEKNHPVIKRISELESTEKEPETVFEEEKESNSEMVQFAQVPEMAIPTSGGIKIILKNAKIYAEKVIITKK